MDNATLALLLTVVVHLAAIGILVWALVPEDADLHGWWRGDDPRDAWPPEPVSPVSGGGLPLPDAMPARVRLREPVRIAEAYPRPERRPARHPAPGVPTPERERA